MQTYITKDGDTADYIAWKYYGNQNAGTVETLIDANKGLADRGPVLPSGVEVLLPIIEQPQTSQGIKLWD